MSKLCKATAVLLISVVFAVSSAALSLNDVSEKKLKDIESNSGSSLNMSEKIERRAEKRGYTEKKSADIKREIEEKVKQKEEEIKENEKQRISAAKQSEKSSRGFLSKILDIFRR